MEQNNGSQEYRNISKQIEVLRKELRECSDLLIHFKIWNENTKEAVLKNSNEIKSLESEIEILKRRNASLDGSISSLNKFSTASFAIALSLCSWVGYTIIQLKQDSAKMQETITMNKASIDFNKADIDLIESRIFNLGIKKND